LYVVLFQALVFEFGLLVSVSKQNAILPIFANGVAQERLNLEDTFRVAVQTSQPTLREIEHRLLTGGHLSAVGLGATGE